MSVRVGCSGWLYRHWRGDFYPPGLRQKDEFAHYASVFDTAEINASFYRTPAETTAAKWADQAPDGFLYAWKYPRWLTHYHRLQDPTASYEVVFARMAPLAHHAGPVLFQLPPRYRADRERLAGALAALPKGARTAWEFRDPSWYAPDVLQVLADHNAALCISDHHHAPAPWEPTADWLYVRGHGPGGRYVGDYPDATLDDWAARLRAWRGDAFVYFDNDIGGAAPRDALRLKARLAR